MGSAPRKGGVCVWWWWWWGGGRAPASRGRQGAVARGGGGACEGGSLSRHSRVDVHIAGGRVVPAELLAVLHHLLPARGEGLGGAQHACVLVLVGAVVGVVVAEGGARGRLPRERAHSPGQRADSHPPPCTRTHTSSSPPRPPPPHTHPPPLPTPPQPSRALTSAPPTTQGARDSSAALGQVRCSGSQRRFPRTQIRWGAGRHSACEWGGGRVGCGWVLAGRERVGRGAGGEAGARGGREGGAAARRGSAAGPPAVHSKQSSKKESRERSKGANTGSPLGGGGPHP